jgi:hypothetical protein
VDLDAQGRKLPLRRSRRSKRIWRAVSASPCPRLFWICIGIISATIKQPDCQKYNAAWRSCSPCKGRTQWHIRRTNRLKSALMNFGSRQESLTAGILNSGTLQNGTFRTSPSIQSQRSSRDSPCNIANFTLVSKCASLAGAKSAPVKSPTSPRSSRLHFSKCGTYCGVASIAERPRPARLQSRA